LNGQVTQVNVVGKDVGGRRHLAAVGSSLIGVRSPLFRGVNNVFSNTDIRRKTLAKSEDLYLQPSHAGHTQFDF
jgi:hypothetical protein